MADANTSALGYIAESTWGTTPGTPELQALRITSDSLRHEKNTVTSAELEASRMTSDLAQVGASALGDIGFELSYATFDAFFESALYSTWDDITDITPAGVTVASDVLTGAASDFDDVNVGGWIKIAGATTTANNGIWRVIAKAVDGSTLTFPSGSLTNDAVSDSGITISQSHLQNGVTEKSFTFERDILHSGTNYFQVFRGMVVASLNLNVQTQQIATGTMGFVGSLGAAGSSTIDNAGGYTASNTNSVMNGTAGVGTIYLDDYSATVPTSTAMTEKMRQFTLAINNNVRGQDALGTLGNFDLGTGEMDLSGTAEVYFADNTLFSDFIAHTYKSYAFTIADGAGNTYVITLPRIQFSDANPALTGKNTDVFNPITWTAIKDTLSNAQMIINRFAA